jgi:hypothetical protein
MNDITQDEIINGQNADSHRITAFSIQAFLDLRRF